MKYILKREMLVCYEKVLIEEEKSQATIEKYMRDVRKFFQYVEEMGKKEGITKEIVLSYKRSLPVYLYRQSGNHRQRLFRRHL